MSPPLEQVEGKPTLCVEESKDREDDQQERHMVADIDDQAQDKQHNGLPKPNHTLLLNGSGMGQNSIHYTCNSTNLLLS